METQFPKSAKYVREHLEDCQDEIIKRRDTSTPPKKGHLFEVMNLLKNEGSMGDLPYEANNLVSIITINTPDDE